MGSDLPAIDIFDQEQSELPNLDGWIFDFADSNNGISPGLPVLDQDVDEATGVDNLSCNDFLQLPECEFASMGELRGMPQHRVIPAFGGSSIKRKRKVQHVSISGKTQHVQAQGLSRDKDSELLPELPAIEIPILPGLLATENSIVPELLATENPIVPELPAIKIPAVGGEQAPAVGGRQKKRTNKAYKVVVRLASASIPWRSLPYMRVQALEEIHAIADLFGSDLGSLSPPAEWLDVGEARRLLNNLQDKQWWHKLGRQGNLQPFTLDQPLAVFLMEIFSGCGNLTYSAALQGMQVAPSIDWRPGQGHSDSFLLNLHKPSDRRIFWALMVCLRPTWTHIGFPCTFWVAIAHWTRIRDLDANQQTRLEALAFIVFARQCVHYQSSRGRHASLENPAGSQAWNLDVVEEMISSSGMGCMQTDLCTWGSVDPWSGKSYQKRSQFSSTFNMAPLARTCSRNHEHEAVQGAIPGGLCKGKRRSALSGQYPLPLCEAWVERAQSQIGRFPVDSR